MDFAARLRQTREARGIGSYELARLIGMSESHVSLWETGARGKDSTPAGHVLDRLASALGVSNDYLLGKTDDERGVVANSSPDATDDRFARLTDTEPSLLRDAVAEIEASPDPELQAILHEVRERESPEGYRALVELLATAWRGNVKMMVGVWRRTHGQEGVP